MRALDSTPPLSDLVHLTDSQPDDAWTSGGHLSGPGDGTGDAAPPLRLSSPPPQEPPCYLPDPPDCRLVHWLIYGRPFPRGLISASRHCSDKGGRRDCGQLPSLWRRAAQAGRRPARTSCGIRGGGRQPDALEWRQQEAPGGGPGRDRLPVPPSGSHLELGDQATLLSSIVRDRMQGAVNPLPCDML